MNEDAVTKAEKRAERLAKRSREYLERLQSIYTRTVGSQPTKRGDERQMFESARYDPNMVAQLYQEIRSLSLSDIDAAQKLINWARKMKG